MKMRNLILLIVLVCAALLSSHPALAQFTQQGGKLVGTGAAGLANQGSVAISADGNTAIVGGADDHSAAGGAVWVFTRSNGVWSQQGSKLVGTDSTFADQGRSVAISADGNTAFVGGWGDDANSGAAWVFTRSGGVWSQQGSKLVGTGATTNAHEGWSAAISGDGNTAIVGANNDNGSAGAVWVYTRSNGVWSQQGNKLVGTGAAGAAHQGSSVAVSGDGNTAVVGGPLDNSNAGAAWLFTRSNGVWSQGAKLVGGGEAGAAHFGQSVAISADGNTAIVGGLTDNSNAGAAWVFTRSGGVWSQQGNKLVGTGAAGAATQGTAVSISGDGNTAVVGGDQDNSAAGAVWVFTRSGSAWSQLGNKLVGTNASGPAAQGASAAISADGATVVVGGPEDAKSGNYAAGAAWVFAAPGGCVTPGRNCVLRVPVPAIRLTGPRP